MITKNFNEINTFEDIDFEPHKSDDSGVQSLITFNDFDLSLIGGDNFDGDGQSHFEIAFLDKSTNEFGTKDIISGYDLLDMNNEDIVRVELEKNWGKELKKEDIVSYVGKPQIMAIINSKKKQASLNNSNKKIKTDDSILKDISNDLIKIAMMPKEYRVSGILNLKLLVDDLDEDNIPKEQVDLIKSIVNDLIDEVKNPQVQEEEIEDEEVDLDADICALNDLLDDAFDVDDVDELNDLLNCEVAKIEQKEEILSDSILAQEFDLLNRSNEMGYRFLENTEDNEKLIEFHRDFVDEETGDVISVGVNKEKKFLIAKDDAQADRWNDWVLNN